MMSGERKERLFFLLACFILFSAILVLTDSASAAEDLSITLASEKIKACACSIYTDEVTLKNTGDSDSIYAIGKLGKTAEWVTVYPQTLNLAKEKTGKFYNLIQIPCDAIGTYSYRTDIITSLGLRRFFERQFEVEKCENIKIDVDSFYKKNCPCTTSTYLINITNPSTFAETYQFGIEPLLEYASISENPVTLQPGESKKVALSVTPTCSIYGKHNLTLLTKTLNTQLIAKTKLVLELDPLCYDYDIVIDEVTTICEDTNRTVRVGLNNTGDISNIFTLDLSRQDDADNWASLDYTSIFVLKNSESYYNLTIRPGLDTEGIHNFTLKAMTSLGNIEREKPMKVKVEKCFLHELNISKTSDRICCGASIYDVYITNTGKFSERFDVSADGPEWAVLETSNRSVSPGDIMALSLNISPSCDDLGKYTVDVASEMRGHPESAHEQSLELDVFSKEQCYQPQLKEKPFTIVLYDNFTSETKTINITNSGVKKASYGLSIEGPEWMSIRPESIEIEPDQSASANIILTPALDTEAAIYDATITLMVADDNTTHSYPVKIILKKPSQVMKQVKQFFRKHALYIGVGAVALAVLIIAFIFGRNYLKALKKRPKKVKKIKKKVEMIVKKVVEKPEKLIVKKKKRISIKRIPRFLLVIFVLLLISLAVLSYFKWVKPAMTEDAAEERGFFERAYDSAKDWLKKIADIGKTDVSEEPEPEEEELEPGKFMKQVKELFRSYARYIGVGVAALAVIIIVFIFGRNYMKALEKRPKKVVEAGDELRKQKHEISALKKEMAVMRHEIKKEAEEEYKKKLAREKPEKVIIKKKKRVPVNRFARFLLAVFIVMVIIFGAISYLKLASQKPFIIENVTIEEVPEVNITEGKQLEPGKFIRPVKQFFRDYARYFGIGIAALIVIIVILTFVRNYMTVLEKRPKKVKKIKKKVEMIVKKVVEKPEKLIVKKKKRIPVKRIAGFLLIALIILAIAFGVISYIKWVSQKPVISENITIEEVPEVNVTLEEMLEPGRLMGQGKTFLRDYALYFGIGMAGLIAMIFIIVIIRQLGRVPEKEPERISDGLIKQEGIDRITALEKEIALMRHEIKKGFEEGYKKKPAREKPEKVAAKKKKTAPMRGFVRFLIVAVIVMIITFAAVSYLGWISKKIGIVRVNETLEPVIEENITEPEPELPEVEPPQAELPQEESLTYWIWDKNTKRTFNLSQYFYDPDGDVLTFYNSFPEHIEVEIKEGIAILTPKRNWHGIEKVMFFAEDDQNALASTPYITLDVRDAGRESGLFSNLRMYAGYILIGIVILAVFILAINEGRESRFGRKRRINRKNSREKRRAKK